MIDVSVVIPYYKRPKFIIECLDSVFSQTYQINEVILVDDGSGDSGFLHQLENRYSKDNLQIIELVNNLGVSAARNIGISKAKNKYIAFCDSDDRWHPEKIQMQLELIKRNSNIKVVHTDERWILNGKNLNPHKKHTKPAGRIFNSCLNFCVVSPSSIIIHKDVFDKVGLFDQKFLVCEDYDMWLRIAKYFNFYFCPDKLVIKYGGHKDQLSRLYNCMDFWRIKALAKHLDGRALSLFEHLNLIEIYSRKKTVLTNGAIKHKNKHLLFELRSL